MLQAGGARGWLLLLLLVAARRVEAAAVAVAVASTHTTAADAKLAVLFHKATHNDSMAAAELLWSPQLTSTQLVDSFAGGPSSVACLSNTGVCHGIRALLINVAAERVKGFVVSSLLWALLASAHRRGISVLQFLHRAGCSMDSNGACNCQLRTPEHLQPYKALLQVKAAQQRNAVSNSTHVLVWLDSSWAVNEAWDSRRSPLALTVGFAKRPSQSMSWAVWLPQACAAVADPCLGGAALLDGEGAEIRSVAELQSVKRVLICPLPPVKRAVRARVRATAGADLDQLVFVAGLEGSAHHGFAVVLKNLAACYLSRLPPCGDEQRRCDYRFIRKTMTTRVSLVPAVNRTMFARSILGHRRVAPNRILGRAVYFEDISFPSGQSMWRKKLVTKSAEAKRLFLKRRPNPVQLEALQELQGVAGVEIKVLMLYRDFAATVWSHKGWDGGLRPHAQLMEAYQQMIADGLAQAPTSSWRVFPADILNRKMPEAVRLSAVTALVEFLGWNLQLPAECPDWSQGWKDSIKQPRQEMGEADWTWLQNVTQNSSSIRVLNGNKLPTLFDWRITSTGGVEMQTEAPPLALAPPPSP